MRARDRGLCRSRQRAAGRALPVVRFTTTSGFTAEAFRMGWYGGAQARRVWRSGLTPGVRQPGAHVDKATRTVSAPWRPSLTVPTSGWPEGSYLIMLTAASGPGGTCR
ncbi:N,N-dimethylformamidase beta subunit family domain-containing protein [Actinomadura monticuli]|uniref:DUF6605 domain-containing protein n=1 Tax=Actinomadura monticuli TaxID=3097367 RepID=A0ABV4QHR5_9ACTN